MNATLMYACSNCDEAYEEESAAQECCPARWVYRCEGCKEVHDDEDVAAECCTEAIHDKK